MAEDKTKDIENAPEPTDKDVAAIREFAKNLGYDFATIPGDIDRDEVEDERWMEENPTWLRAAQTIYMMEKGINADPALTQSIDQMTDEQRGELSEWGFDHMGWTDDNLWSLKQRVDSIENATPEQQAAFLYMMETYGQLDMSVSETANALWRGFTSPENAAIMAGSFGLGLFTGGTSILAGLGAVAARTVASRGALAVAKRYLTSTIGKAVAGAAIEGTIAGLADGHLRQKIQTSTGVVDYDLSKTLEGGAYGAAFGAALGGGFFVGGKVAKKGVQSITAKFSKSADGSATPAAADAPKDTLIADGAPVTETTLDADSIGKSIKTPSAANDDVAGTITAHKTKRPVMGGAPTMGPQGSTLLTQMNGMAAHPVFAPDGLGGGAPNTPHMQPQPQQQQQAKAAGGTGGSSGSKPKMVDKRLDRPGDKNGTAEEILNRWLDKHGDGHKNWWNGLSATEKQDVLQKIRDYEPFERPHGNAQQPKTAATNTAAQQPATGTVFQGAYGQQTVNGAAAASPAGQPQGAPQNLGATWGAAQGSYGPQTVNAGPNYTAGTATGAGAGTGTTATATPTGGAGGGTGGTGTTPPGGGGTGGGTGGTTPQPRIITPPPGAAPLPQPKVTTDYFNYFLFRHKIYSPSQWWNDFQKLRVESAKTNPLPIIKPVVRYVDESMKKFGIIDELKALSSNIQAAKTNALDMADLQGKMLTLMSDFSQRNRTELSNFKAEIKALRDHVYYNYNDVVIPKNNGTVHALVESQNHKKVLLNYLDDMIDLADDLQEPDFKNTGKRVRTLQYQDGIPINSAEDLADNSLHHILTMANDAHGRLSAKSPFTSPLAKNEVKIEERDALLRTLSTGVYDRTVSLHKRGDSANFELSFQKLETRFEDYIKTKDDGSRYVDWGMEAPQDIATQFGDMYMRGYRHEALILADAARRRRGSEALRTLPEQLADHAALVARVGPEVAQSDDFKKFQAHLRDRISMSQADGRQDRGLTGFDGPGRKSAAEFVKRDEFWKYLTWFAGHNQLSTPGRIEIKNNLIFNPSRKIRAYLSGGRTVPSDNADDLVLKIERDWWWRGKSSEEGISWWDNNWLARSPWWFKMPGRLITAPLYPGYWATKQLLKDPIIMKGTIATGILGGALIALEEGALEGHDYSEGIFFDQDKNLIVPESIPLIGGAQVDAGSRIAGAAMSITDSLIMEPLRWSAYAAKKGTQLLTEENSVLGTGLQPDDFSLDKGINGYFDPIGWNKKYLGDRGENNFEEELERSIVMASMPIHNLEWVMSFEGIDKLTVAQQNELKAKVISLNSKTEELGQATLDELTDAEKTQMLLIEQKIQGIEQAVLNDKRTFDPKGLTPEELKQLKDFSEEMDTILYGAAARVDAKYVTLGNEIDALENEIFTTLEQVARQDAEITNKKTDPGTAVAVEDEPDLEKDTGDEKKKTQEKKDESGQEKQETYEAQIKRLEKQITELQKDADKNKQEIKKLQEMIAGLKAGDEKAVAEAKKYFEKQQAKELENWKQAGLDAAESTWNWLKPRELGQNDKFGRTANNLGTFFGGAAKEGFDVAWSFLTDLADPNTGKYGKNGQSWLQYAIAAGVGLISPTLLENAPVFGKIFKLLHKIPILGPMITAVGAFLLTKKMLEGAMKTPQAVLMTSDDKTEVKHTPPSVTRDGGSMRVQSGKGGQRIEYRLANETLDATLSARKAAARNIRGEDVGHAVQQSGQNLPNAIRRSNSVTYTVGSGTHIPTVLKPSNDQFIVTPDMGKDHAASTNGNSTVRAFGDAANRYENMPDAVAKTAGPGAYAAYNGGMQRVQGDGTVDYIVEPHGKSAAAMAPAPEYEVRH